MKEFNLNRLMMSCCVDIDNEYYNELFDYLIMIDVDLNELNIDNLVVNGIQFLDKEDAEDYYILKETEDGCWCI
tara:strand:- start:1436 stop:1657 length:222 start_codon:yes stop_codon:yes gene_type:complete